MFWLPLWLVVVVQTTTTDPCLLTPPTVFRSPAAQLDQLAVGFCWDGLDTNGQPILGPVGFKLDIDGAPAIDLGPLLPLTPPNANGDSYYQTLAGVLPQGGSMHVHAYSATGESAGSPSWLLTLLGPPKPPKKGVVVKE